MFDNYLEIYDVGIYLRLSKEDGEKEQKEKKDQSESIANQLDFVTRHVLERGWNLKEIYIDDGYTGLNYDRPDFKRMITDIENKKINLVITKDLSRLGRDYIDTGYYLERYFPQNNVRYIAICDGIDTFMKNGNNDISPFKAVINDMYAKDISKKVRAVMDTKRKNGKFIGAFAPYGYIKDPKNKNDFLIDEVSADVVRRIFRSYLDNMSMGSIVTMLNDEKVFNPAKYKLHTSNYKNALLKEHHWTQETIKRILTNPSYMGNMAQGRQEKINYKLNKFRKIDPKNWIIAENTHEPIISPDDFHIVQELIEKRIVHYAKPEINPHLLNGLVFCKDCGAKMTYRRNSCKKMITLCMTYSKYGPTLCTSHVMHEKTLDDYVIGELKIISAHVLDDKYYQQFEGMKIENDNKTDKRINEIIRKLNEVKEIIKALYLDKVRGIIDEDIFLSMSDDYSAEKECLSREYAKLIEEQKATQNSKKEVDFMSIIRDISNFDTIDKTLLFKLIERIEISAEREVFITWKFKTPYK